MTVNMRMVRLHRNPHFSFLIIEMLYDNHILL